jgi:hypothetical protein
VRVALQEVHPDTSSHVDQHRRGKHDPEPAQEAAMMLTKAGQVP